MRDEVTVPWQFQRKRALARLENTEEHTINFQFQQHKLAQSAASLSSLTEFAQVVDTTRT